MLVATRDAPVKSFTYAAVIPKWTSALLQGEPVFINGDGETSRDFCFVTNAVQANLLADTVAGTDARNQVYNLTAHGIRGKNNERQTLFPQFGYLH